MKTLTVDLGSRSYPIYIGESLTNPELYRSVVADQAMIVTNTTVAPMYLAQFKETLSSMTDQVDVVELPDGEEYKSLAYFTKIIDELLTQRHSRTTTVFALGGGVVGDMSGFAAAAYQRGVNFVQVPTTLLSQVDSSVGGKVAVNHPMGKNMIGAFYQPKAVIIDVATLSTLPKEEFAAGFAEVIKYGLIRDAEFFEWLEANFDAIFAKKTDVLIEMIYRSCVHKAQVVAEDERESGVRALLNLGHTFGHAIEAGMGYGKVLHGEAVAIGTVVAAEFSRRLGHLTSNDVARIVSLFSQAGLPISIPEQMTAETMLDLMQLDKKVERGQLKLILLKKIGEGYIDKAYDAQQLQELLEALCAN